MVKWEWEKVKDCLKVVQLVKGKKMESMSKAKIPNKRGMKALAILVIEILNKENSLPLSKDERIRYWSGREKTKQVCIIWNFFFGGRPWANWVYSWVLKFIWNATFSLSYRYATGLIKNISVEKPSMGVQKAIWEKDELRAVSCAQPLLLDLAGLIGYVPPNSAVN